MALKAGYLFLAGAGGIFIWSGIQGKSVSGVARALIGGQAPNQAPNALQIASITPDTSSTDGGNTGNAGAANYTAAQNQALAKTILTHMGLSSWTTGNEWDSLVKLWNQESGWSATADNPQSGAYGIAQALPAAKYPAGGQKSGGSNPGVQITWGITYILGRYGTPSMAWAHEVSNGWY